MMFSRNEAFHAIQQWASYIRDGVVELKESIPKIKPDQTNNFHDRILLLTDELKNSQSIVDEAIRNYEVVVKEYLQYLQKISRNGLIFSPQAPEYNLKTFDLLVGQSMVVGHPGLLDKWGIEPLKNWKCEQALGAKEFQYREWLLDLKKQTNSEEAKEYYDYIINQLFS